MDALSRFARRVWYLLNRRRLERELAEEMAAHREQLGDTRAFGSPLRLREESADVWGWTWLDDLRRDFAHAVRALWHAPSFAVTSIVALALGIGANAALFTAVNGEFLRPLAVDAPDELVRLRITGPNEMSTSSWGYGYTEENGERARGTFPYAVYLAMIEANDTLTGLVAGAPVEQVNVQVDGQAELATGYMASGNYHDVLGVPALRGRVLQPDDDRDAAPPVAVISEGFWTRRFGGDDGVIGETVLVNGVPVTIVGVTPARFTGIQRTVADGPDLTLPLVLERRLQPPREAGGTTRLDEATTWWLQLMGRLHLGVTPAQVRGNFEGVFQATARANMSAFLDALPADERALSRYQDRTAVPRLAVSSGARGLHDTTADQTQSMAILGGVVLLILLLVCANVANLLLSRTASRHREISVRLSMGATRWRVVRQLLTESVLLAMAGGTVGMVVAAWGRQLLPGTAANAPLDWRVLSFVGGLSVLTGLAFGTLPALRATTMAAGTALKEAGRTMSTRSRLSRALLVAQVAISMVLLVGAGLFLRTVGNLQQVDVGFNAENLVVFRVNPQLSGYDPARTVALYDRMVSRIGAVPGVRAVTLSNPPLLSGAVNSTELLRPGDVEDRSVDREIFRMRVAANFFDTLEMPLVSGRSFTAADLDGAPRVAVLNQAAVRKFFADGNPIGRTFGSSPEETGDIEVVGVVADSKYNSVRDDAPPTMYVPYLQYGIGGMAFEIRTIGDASAVAAGIRTAVRDVDATVPLMNLTTQVELASERIAQERFFARASASFSGLALLVAAIGLFGLMSYSVARRTNEIGIRMALGADRRRVMHGIIRESLTLVLVGASLGVLGAAGAGRLVASQLYGVTPFEPAAFTTAVTALLGASLLAGYGPARRATRVDPMTALRSE